MSAQPQPPQSVSTPADSSSPEGLKIALTSALKGYQGREDLASRSIKKAQNRIDALEGLEGGFDYSQVGSALKQGLFGGAAWGPRSGAAIFRAIAISIAPATGQLKRAVNRQEAFADAAANFLKAYSIEKAPISAGGVSVAFEAAMNKVMTEDQITKMAHNMDAKAFRGM